MPYQATIDEVTPAEWEHAAQAFADYTIYQTWAYQQGRAERDHQQVHRVVLRDQSGRVRSLCHVRVKTVEAVRLRVGYVQWGPLVRLKTGENTASVEMFETLKTALLQTGVTVLRLVPNLLVDGAAAGVADLLDQAGLGRVPACAAVPYAAGRCA